jgi:hypothetical protein
MTTNNDLSFLKIALILSGLLVIILATDAEAGLNKIIGVKIHLIGRDLNGIDLNGKELDGLRVAYVNLDNIQLDGQIVEKAKLEQTVFSGKLAGNKKVKRTDFIGSVFEATLTDSDTLLLSIDDIQKHDDKMHRDVYRYLVSYNTADSWEPLCGYDEDNQPVYAIPLKGRWIFEEGVAAGGSKIEDEGVFTFACQGYVLAKCVEAGYKPWDKALVCKPHQGCHIISLADHHQACTRLLRADYCGDGTPHTQDNIWINMYDDFGIRIDADDWLLEAEWNADGATCMSSSRLESETPACFEYLVSDECGDPAHFSAGTLLMSEITP